MLRLITLTQANDNRHKYKITLEDTNTKKMYNVKFGAFGYDDYTISQNDNKKNNYILRHQVREDWTDPLKKGTLSRYLLWNKPTLHSSLKDYIKRFNIIN